MDVVDRKIEWSEIKTNQYFQKRQWVPARGVYTISSALNRNIYVVRNRLGSVGIGLLNNLNLNINIWFLPLQK